MQRRVIRANGTIEPIDCPCDWRAARLILGVEHLGAIRIGDESLLFDVTAYSLSSRMVSMRNVTVIETPTKPANRAATELVRRVPNAPGRDILGDVIVTLTEDLK